jgi:porin
MDRCNKTRNVTLLSQWGLADPETSPIGWSANIGIQAQGFNSSRPHDSMGIGYFHTGISDDLHDLLTPVFDLHDIDGVELYYNMAVMKGFQLTSDLQVIDPAERRDDTAIVVGLRGTIGM